VFWGDFARREPETHIKAMHQLLEWHSAGKIRPHVSETYALAETPQALIDMASRKVTGKIVIQPRR
jgi:NADPH2:quinone reductase